MYNQDIYSDIRMNAGMRQNTQEIKTTRFLAIGLISMILSGSSMIGEFSPFSIAFMSSLSRFDCVAAFLGSMLGYVVGGNIGSSIGYICAMLAILAIRTFVSHFFSSKELVACPIVVCLVMFITGMIISNTEGYWYDIALIICEAILAGAITYFLLYSYMIIRAGMPLKSMMTAEIASLGMVAGLFVCALTSYDFLIFNLGRISAVLIIMLCAHHYKHVGGAIAGIIVAAGVMLSSPSLGAATLMFGVAGLLSGLFQPFGRVAQTATFISVNAVGLIILGVNSDTIFALSDVFVATSTFALLPDKAINLFLQKNKLIVRCETDVSAAISERLKFAASTMGGVKKSVEQVSDALSKDIMGDFSWIYENASDKVCKTCKLNMRCWQENYDTTVSSLSGLVSQFRNKSRLDLEDLPDYLQYYCCRRERLIKEINYYHDDYLLKKRMNRNLAQMRWLLSEQLDSMESILIEMGEDIAGKRYVDDKASKSVQKILERAGMTSAKACASNDTHGRMCIEAYGDKKPSLSVERICSLISDELMREFEIPEVYEIDDRVRLIMHQRASYEVEFKACQYTSTRSDVSGDNYEYFTDSKGYAYICLSDGMGSGKRAAIDSMMVCALMMKLLRGGMGIDATLKIINSSMIVKSTEESFATIDLCRIDLFTGRAELFKAGAAPTYVKKGKKISRFESTSLPIGMLQGAEVESRQIRLSDKDYIVMISDGACEGGNEWIEEELADLKLETSEELAEHISLEAKLLRNKTNNDDITVMAIRLNKVI